MPTRDDLPDAIRPERDVRVHMHGELSGGHRRDRTCGRPWGDTVPLGAPGRRIGVDGEPPA